MDYNNELKSLRIDKKKIVDDIVDLDKKKEEELKELKKIIDEKYSELKQKSYSKLDEKTVEVNDCCKLIEKKSTMSYMIFLVLAEIMSIFEGETYVIEKIHYHKDKTPPSEVWESYMIISNNILKNIKNPRYVSEIYFNHLQKNGLAIKIVEGWSVNYLPQEFSFYKTDDIGRINPQISYKGFPYVKQFIDYIINYRIENSIDELSYDELEKLKKDFILMNVDNIYNNYEVKQEKRIKESTKSINSECEHNKKLLKRFVKKMEANR